MCNVPEKIRRAILELARKGTNIYGVAKELGVTYGTAQWWISCLERQGVVKTRRVGKRRYIFVGEGKTILVEDLLEELRRAVRGLERIDAERAIAELEERGLRHVAEALRAIMVARLQEAV